MIVLSEQYGYRSPKSIADIESYTAILNKKDYRKSIQKGDNQSYCFNITHHENELDAYRFETSYFVGVDWIVQNILPIYVRPKLNDSNQEINYVEMLFDILQETENHTHLDQLCHIDFDKPNIAIQQDEDLLTPLLLVQYLHLLKRIVQKGLKKSYYPVKSNLNAKVKGRILVNETIKRNHFNNKLTFNYCSYSEFGINSMENKLLKKAMLFSIAAIQNLKGVDALKAKGLTNYIQPAFQQVGTDVDIDAFKTINSNSLYHEYDAALKFAKLILKRYGYTISTVSTTKINTPPFWIDMSKLFELYVFSKLKERFPHHKEVTYHKIFNYLEPDFIIKSSDGKTMVVDAKYKPQYENGNISKEDIRQVSGYARLEKVYAFLEMEKKSVIDCLIIYSNQDSKRKNFKGDNFELVKEENYVGFYKIGIELPYRIIDK